ncbi:MAG TPA: aminopeptidase P family protein [Chloroflexi bacterium]|nr:aminopeptidase P family protein [Chloroflexota bacterium]HBY07414.1 aminopeptidase P family protein [Chloroflexota bacterium]
MKTELDRLMQERNFDAMLITGPAQHNPAMYYLTGGGHITSADLIKPRGAGPVLYHNPMERDEAAATGLKTKNFVDYNWGSLLKQAGGDTIKATALRYKAMLADQGISRGRLAVYGKGEIGANFAVLSALQAAMPDLEIVGETDRNSMMLEAMSTKDANEINRIRQMGVITTAVVGQVADFLTSHKVKDEMLVKNDGQPLTIGDVKGKINLWLAEKGVENPHGTIFAIGRDAGVPHSTGTPTDVMALGKTIVFDIYPCEAGGGYHYDFTRTWCLGYAPDEVLAIYDDVYSVYQDLMEQLRLNVPFKAYQDLTCDLFENQGHATIKDDSSVQEGYVHSVGHGLGLNIHEAPWSGSGAGEKDLLAPGAVITIEPGLYYPSKGMGCRLEDSVAVHADGSFEILADYPLDLVLPLKG